jgi:hypothetical protein
VKSQAIAALRADSELLVQVYLLDILGKVHDVDHL